MVAAVTHPISLFWFAWTSYQSIHPVVPVLASALWVYLSVKRAGKSANSYQGWSFYTLILMTYLYTEDSYGMFSASALAGLGLVRNLFGYELSIVDAAGCKLLIITGADFQSSRTQCSRTRDINGPEVFSPSWLWCWYRYPLFWQDTAQHCAGRVRSPVST